jgi:hypothetical protein
MVEENDRCVFWTPVLVEDVHIVLCCERLTEQGRKQGTLRHWRTNMVKEVQAPLRLARKRRPRCWWRSTCWRSRSMSVRCWPCWPGSMRWTRAGRRIGSSSTFGRSSSMSCSRAGTTCFARSRRRPSARPDGAIRHASPSDHGREEDASRKNARLGIWNCWSSGLSTAFSHRSVRIRFMLRSKCEWQDDIGVLSAVLKSQLYNLIDETG